MLEKSALVMFLCTYHLTWKRSQACVPCSFILQSGSLQLWPEAGAASCPAVWQALRAGTLCDQLPLRPAAAWYDSSLPRINHLNFFSSIFYHHLRTILEREKHPLAAPCACPDRGSCKSGLGVTRARDQDQLAT